MSISEQILEFDPLDNPMHLKKVGNWVLTFLSSPEQIDHIQLAITNVVPRQADGSVQARRIVIEQSKQEHQWTINHIECFDSESNKEIIVQASENLGAEIIHNLQNEFRKYDVEVLFIA